MYTPEQEQEMYSWALKNNSGAMEFFAIACRISQTFDDMWDGDNPVSRDQQLSMMLMAMVDLPRTDFFRVMGPDAVTLVENTWMRWIESNDIEETKDIELLKISYITRSALTDMLIEMAGMLYGREWRRKVAGKVRPWVYCDNEPYSEYLKEHRQGV